MNTTQSNTVPLVVAVDNFWCMVSRESSFGSFLSKKNVIMHVILIMFISVQFYYLHCLEAKALALHFP